MAEEFLYRNYPSQVTPAWGFASSVTGFGRHQVDLPFMYDFINREWSRVSPNTVHCKNTQLTYFWCEQLMQRAMSVLKWKLPKEVNPYYFKWGINTFGIMGLFTHEKFGKLALIPGLKDYDIYYYPKTMIFANRCFEEIVDWKRWYSSQSPWQLLWLLFDSFSICGHDLSALGRCRNLHRQHEAQ